MRIVRDITLGLIFIASYATIFGELLLHADRVVSNGEYGARAWREGVHANERQGLFATAPADQVDGPKGWGIKSLIGSHKPLPSFNPYCRHKERVSAPHIPAPLNPPILTYCIDFARITPE